MENVIKKITFVGGKGGVGKYSTAAALAWKAARDGEKTLLISTDPAHNLGDLFERTIGGQVTQLMDNLFALEIDPERETEIYIQQVKENIDRKSTRLNSSHVSISYAVFCLKKK